MSVPNDIRLVEGNGVDSDVFKLTNDKGFVLNGSIGKYKSSILNLPLTIIDLKFKDSLLKRVDYKYDSSIVFFSDDADLDRQQNTFSKNFYRYTYINGLKVKLIEPKTNKDGLTGMVVKNVRDDESLTIYGEDFGADLQQLAMEIFQTVKLKQ